MRRDRSEIRTNEAEEAALDTMTRQLGVSRSDVWRMALAEFCAMRGVVIK